MERSAPPSESEEQATEQQDSFAVTKPSITLPKGGGAIRGMGEKFAANPVTGTGSMTIPIATSPGRSGFGPQLSLSYDSGVGNGPFGFGWNLALPSIKRKTDKGLPQYLDGHGNIQDSDVFILSGAEDLVPIYRQDADGAWIAGHPDYRRDPEGFWVRDSSGRLVIHEDEIGGYRVRRYRPRIEGLFARIERWTLIADTTDVHWRSISKDNILTIYGKDSNSRIVDPENPARIFNWLICETRDDKGNGILYIYKAEDETNVQLNLASERNRGGLNGQNRTANRYLKQILYGNRTTLLDGAGRRPHFLSEAQRSDAHWLFEVVFDYDEDHYRELPWEPSLAATEQHHRAQASQSPPQDDTWSIRPDPFSTYRAGFEVRTYRRCHRVLMFHHFGELTTQTGGAPYLVSATEFHYNDLNPDAPVTVEAELAHPGSTRYASFIQSVSQSGFVHDANTAPVSEGNANYVTYLKKSLPPLEFEYSKAVIDETVRELDSETLENLPIGIDNQLYRWVDLDGEGLSGILTEQGNAWHYKSNLGNGHFGPSRILPNKPNVMLANGAHRLVDLAGNGQLDIAAFGGAMPGFYERTHDDNWQSFRAFRQVPNIRWDDPNIRFVDLNGDGRADVLITENEVLTWYPSSGEEGFDPARKVTQPADEEHGPRLVFADGTDSIYLADMCGDGLTGLVRIRNGEVCYWPNLGYGRFGAKVTMDNAPHFDNPDHFDQQRIRLADIDGSGTNDIIYLHRDGVRCYFNQSGNGWSDARNLGFFPLVDNLTTVMTADLLGNGTACLVWSSPLPARSRSPLRYIDLMSGRKPHLLTKTKNNLGLETEVTYAPSTRFYLADQRVGAPWVTRIPFPVHCVEKVTVSDKWRNTRFSTTYSYHHGYFDGVEREFRGFGRVEQVDSEHFGLFAAGNSASPYITDDRQLYQPPVKTVTWYHTGALQARRRILSHFANEYFPHSVEHGGTNTFQENSLPEPDLEAASLNADEYREALRACKGMALRQEIYELDVDALADDIHRPVKLFSAANHNCHIRKHQPQGGNRHAVFLVTESEAITYHYELDMTQPALHPDPRIAHTLNLRVDEYGNVLQSVAVVYPRIGRYSDPSLPESSRNRIENIVESVQQERHLVYTENRYTGNVDDAHDYRLRLPCEAKTFELVIGNDTNRSNRYYTLQQLRALNPAEIPERQYHEPIDRAQTQKRLVQHARTLFFNENLQDPLALGELNRLGLPYESYKLALTESLLAAIFQADQLAVARPDLENPSISGYFRFADAPEQFWVRSGVAGFNEDAPQTFYLPERYTDAFGNTTTLDFDRNYNLFLQSSRDPVGNVTEVTAFDYRVLAPNALKDPNDNITETVYDILGQPAAVAAKGKNDGSEGDRLDAFNADINQIQPPIAQVAAVFTESYADSTLQELLDTATARHLYWFGETVDPVSGAITYGDNPAGACGILRETHSADLVAGALSPIQVSFEYTDGGGKVLVQKMKAEPGQESGPGDPLEPLRWLTNGRTIFNNKGKPVKQYEPAFSLSAQRFDEPPAEGVTAVTYYDAADRVVRTEQPDGSYSRAVFTPWQAISYDANDTVLEADNAWYVAQNPLDPASPLPRDTAGRTLATPAQRAAWLAAKHAGTPARVFLDSLGREVVSVAHNVYRDSDDIAHDERIVTYTKLDAEGKPLWIRDDRGNLVMQYIRPQKPTMAVDEPHENMPDGSVPCYDIAGNLLYQYSMDGGERWLLNDAAGQPLYSWDFNTRQPDTGAQIDEHRIFNTVYDALRRPLQQRLKINAGDWQVVERIVYGDTPDLFPSPAPGDLPQEKTDNLRGQIVRHYDPSGLITNRRFDFKGNLLQTERQLATAVKVVVIHWPENPPAEALGEVFYKSEAFDALNRMIRLENWHRRSNDSRPPAVYTPGYNERGLLAAEALAVHGRTRNAIVQIAYNAKGQRTYVEFGNGTVTRYDYDPLTFRLRQLRTTRLPYDPAFPNTRGDLSSTRIVQNLFYTYDPVGNITEIHDDAFEPAFFNGQQVQAQSAYVYDAIYRLIKANGREHADTVGVPPQRPPNAHGITFPVNSSGDHNALRNYTQYYHYDTVGNIQRMQHNANGGNLTRHYRYADDSNRLARTWTGGESTNAIDYRYDTHGSMQNLDRTLDDFSLRWDTRDMIRSVNLGGGGWAWYQYDAQKQRTRKRIEQLNGGNTVEERLYLDGMELYRRWNGDNLVEEIETHHLFLDDQRALIVEDVIRTDNTDLPAAVLYRYQYSNHLGSVGLELNAAGEVISYEEYHPYGTTAYQARNAVIHAKAKRYRYTGMERDEETGLSYHTARYYAPWLGRWGSCDPIGVEGGMNLYLFSLNSPTNLQDKNGKQPLPYDFNTPVDFEMYLYSLLLGTGLETLIGGHFVPPPDGHGTPRLPEGGVGGVIGGVAHTLTLRQTEILEEYPSLISQEGMDFGGSLVPVLGPGENLYFNETVSGAPIDPETEATFLLLDVALLGFDGIAARAATVEGRVVRGEVRLAARDSRFVTTEAQALEAGGRARAPLITEGVAREGTVVAERTMAPRSSRQSGWWLEENRVSAASAVRDERPDVYVGALRRWRITPGERYRGVTPRIRREVRQWAARMGTMDGPPTTGPVHAGHQWGGSHVFTLPGETTRVGAQTARGNLSQASDEARAAAARRRWNAAHPNGPQFPVRDP